MKTVLLWENALERTHETHEVEDVRDFLMARFATWPETARIYHQEVAQDHDVTPADVAGIERLGALPGPFLVVVYPGEPTTIAIVASAVVMAASVAMSFLFRPQVPNLGRSTPGSSNNDLSDRQNQARVNGRIADILGTVRSTPDLIAQPYKVFENNREIEYALMCVGRGSYEIATREDGLYDVRDDTTPIENIAAACVKVYGPGASTDVTTDAAGLITNTPLIIPADRDFTEPVRTVKRFTSVNGQELLGPNEALKCSIRFVAPDLIELHPDEQVDFLEHFNPGGSLALTASVPSDWAGLKSFNGTYTIASVTERTITLTNPVAVNDSWNPDNGAFDYYPPYATETYTKWITGLLGSSVSKKVGPFDLDVPEQTEVWCNVVAPSGLYKIDGSNVQTAVDVAFGLIAVPIDAAGNIVGEPSDPTEKLAWYVAHTHAGTLNGSSVDRNQRATTFKVTLPATGRYRVWMYRTTEKNYSWTGQIQEEIQWRDVYSVAPVALAHFGDVTLVQSRMEANKNALAVKNRKLNLLVTRKVKRYGVAPLDADGFSTALLPTNNAADLLIHVCRDPHIGNRALDEIDVEGIHATIADVVSYFGTSQAAEFNATLDKENLSFEETVAMIAGAVFCQAYRRGSTIRLNFEKETEDSVLLFNHRNVLPDSFRRTFTFASPEAYDGVELEYVDPADDSVQVYYVPEDRSAVNPRKIETVGLRSKLQAYWHAQRAMNRLRYQRDAREFEATQEADLLVLGDRVLVADGSRARVQPQGMDGQVLDAVGLEVKVSQPVTFQAGKTYTIFLQLSDGTVEAMPVSAGSDAYHVTLARAPRLPLVADPKTAVQGTLWWIVDDSAPSPRAFLVTEKQPGDRMTSTLSVVNYDARYYSADGDFLRGVIGEDGNPVG